MSQTKSPMSFLKSSDVQHLLLKTADRRGHNISDSNTNGGQP